MKKRELLARIEALEARVARLEARPAPGDIPLPVYPPGYFTPYSTGNPPPRPPIVTCTPTSGSITLQH